MIFRALHKVSCYAPRSLSFPPTKLFESFAWMSNNNVRRGIQHITLSMTADNCESTKEEDVVQMPGPLPAFKNTYYMLRHGQSTANVKGVISSARSLAYSDKHGLTELGRQQGRSSAKALIDLLEQDLKQQDGTTEKARRVFFYTSPFARAKQTAEACLEGLSAAVDKDESIQSKLGIDIQFEEKIAFEDGIMERFFGRLDGLKLYTYAYVWPVDMYDVTHKGYDVESVAEVCTRVGDALKRIDGSEKHSEGGDIIVLVSHADTLQIMQVYAAGLENVGKFSSYRFGNGEVRAMKRTTDSLPEPVPLLPPKPET
eukprot:CAMPEP_0195524138 /NCGR_PEP_ID=MMETSP0794_2-20130614/23817_1 /TAXON_ID=515487 /ORGANISM="Stephanopyxis turris, Strain CCMP 815" /LENGTH=313 /DNA_ID=CAMNT_0040654301 /DNA_START=82 /DNA_END=1023 /DNA_ORIENTATION=-